MHILIFAADQLNLTLTLLFINNLFIQVTGKIIYNGQELSPSNSQHLRVYICQHDLHHPEMTVEETLDFSQRIFETENIFGKNYFIQHLVPHLLFIKLSLCVIYPSVATHIINKLRGLILLACILGKTSKAFEIDLYLFG